MDNNMLVTKFRLNLYELETVLSMSPLYGISQEELIERLKEINSIMKDTYEEHGIDLNSTFDEMDRVKAAFKNNKIEIYTVK